MIKSIYCSLFLTSVTMVNHSNTNGDPGEEMKRLKVWYSKRLGENKVYKTLGIDMSSAIKTSVTHGSRALLADHAISSRPSCESSSNARAG
jgi:hypothetical protein